MAWTFFNFAKLKIADGTIDLDTNTFKMMLTTSSYTPDIDTHDYRDDVTNEITGTGYTAGGATMANNALSQDNTNDRVIWDADDVQWTSATFTFRIAVIYKSNGGAASADELVCYNDFGSDQSVTSGTLTVQFNGTTGIATLA